MPTHEFHGDSVISINSIDQYIQYWSAFSVRVPCAENRCSLLHGAPGLVDAPRIRAIRLESLPRASRGGPPHPARNLIQLAIVNPLRTGIRCGTLGFPPVNTKRFSPQRHKDTKTNYLPEQFFASFRFFAVSNVFPALPASRLHPGAPGKVLNPDPKFSQIAQCCKPRG